MEFTKYKIIEKFFQYFFKQKLDVINVQLHCSHNFMINYYIYCIQCTLIDCIFKIKIITVFCKKLYHVEHRESN